MHRASFTNNKLPLNRSNICSDHLNHTVDISRLQLPSTVSEVNYFKCFRSDVAVEGQHVTGVLGTERRCTEGKQGTVCLCQQHSNFML